MKPFHSWSSAVTILTLALCAGVALAAPNVRVKRGDEVEVIADAESAVNPLASQVSATIPCPFWSTWHGDTDTHTHTYISQYTHTQALLIPWWGSFLGNKKEKEIHRQRCGGAIWSIEKCVCVCACLSASVRVLKVR